MLVESAYHRLSDLDRLCINTLRFLSIDAVQKAKSGHPGFPMGIAPTLYRLFTKHLKYNPQNPSWINRDRFILSAGHGSAALYSILHLVGYDISIEDLKNFRQLDSKTPGHPEYGHTPGVEATTGPLGQGLSNAVGMAIAAKHAGAHFNQEDLNILDHNIYVIAGDGCLQEGITSEASSLAGHQGLDNLIVIYDDNNITIDGSTELSFTEDVVARYKAYGWYVQEIGGDGHDLMGLDKAIENAKAQNKAPSLIKLKTVIGYGSPNKQNSSGVHGSPLGEEEIQLTKKTLGWNTEESFFVPDSVKEIFSASLEKGKALETEWNETFSDYQTKYPVLSQQFITAQSASLPAGWDKDLPTFEGGSKVATRSVSGKVLDAVMPKIPLMMGGSADLSPSNNTRFKGSESFQKKNQLGRYIHYGVREHAMGAIMNGISIYELTRAYGATFLAFSDYVLPSIRLAALSGYSTVFVFTHDSIGLGEDGPTHQPVEQVAYLRAMPGLVSFRPADANETVEAWKYILNHPEEASAIILTRQNLLVLDQEKYGSAKQVEKGAYILKDSEKADVLLIASGSEVELVMKASEELDQAGISTKVVSIPSAELFERQSAEYQAKVIPPNMKKRVVVEAGLVNGLQKYLGETGRFVGMNSFGASAPAGELFEKFGITVESVIKNAKLLMR